MKTSSLTERSVHEIHSHEGVDVQKLGTELEQTLTDLNTWIAEAQTHEHTLLALWPSQSPDGRKYQKLQPDNKHVFPYEGAPDTRNRLADASVDEIVQLKLLAFFQSSMRTIAMEANDTDSAGRVQTLLHYEIKQRLLAELWEELNYAVNWSEAYGHAVLGTFWRKSTTTGLETITIEDLAVLVQQQLQAEQAQAQAESGIDPALIQPPEPQDEISIIEDAFAIVESYLMDKEFGEDPLIELISAKYPTLPEKRVRKVIARLRKEGIDTFRLPVEKPGRPTVQAYMPGFDIFYPWHVGNVKNAPWVAVQEYLWEPDLLAKERDEGWDPDFIQQLLRLGPGPCIDQASIEKKLGRLQEEPRRLFEGRGAGDRYVREREQVNQQYAVLRIFVRGVDEDNIAALHEVVMRPEITRTDGTPLVAINQITDYYHEGGCFTSLRREYKTRSLWENHGIPEQIVTDQMELKTNRDARIARIELNTFPPVRAPAGRAAGGGDRLAAYNIAPGSTVTTTRSNYPGDQVDFMRLPGYDERNETIERAIHRDVANLLGLNNPDLPAEKLQIHRQYLVLGFLIQMRELVLKILSLDQQFMSPIQVSRVIGSGEQPFTVTREEIAGQYDVHLSFDVKSLNPEWLKERLSVLKEAVQFDRSGAFKDVPVMRYLLSSIDPNLADLAIADIESARESEMEDEKKALGTLLSGVEIKPPAGANAQVRLETDRQEIANNPIVNQRYQADPWFQRMMDRRMAKWEFDLQQRQNAQTGRDGWIPAMDDAEEMMNTPDQPPA